MGIAVEFNPDLALRNIEEFRKGLRKKEECIPENISKGSVHDFLKFGQRNYWLEGEIPLIETKGNSQFSKPIASIIILESTHLIVDGKPCTKGKYKVVDVFDINDGKIHFNACERIK